MYPMLGASEGMSAIREWEYLTRQIFANAELQVDATARPLRLWQRAGLEDLVMNTAPGGLVGDSNMTREIALRRSAMFQALLVFLATPIKVGVDTDGNDIMESPLDMMSIRQV